MFTKPGSFVRQPPLVFDLSHWLLPMYYTPSRSITEGAEANYSAVKITRDGGETWKECEIPQSGGLVQPNVLKLRHGVFVAFFRSRFADFIYKSTSSDGCRWTAPIPTQLPNNNSSIQALLLRNGHIVMAFNNTSSSIKREKTQAGPRKPLSVALSTDGGQTWPWIRDIETGSKEPEHPEDRKHEDYSYPAVVQEPDGKIDVAYTYRRERIKVVQFDEEWIKRGSTIGKFKGDNNHSGEER
jgi:predicted neuraminidase